MFNIYMRSPLLSSFLVARTINTFYLLPQFKSKLGKLRQKLLDFKFFRFHNTSFVNWPGGWELNIPMTSYTNIEGPTSWHPTRERFMLNHVEQALCQICRLDWNVSQLSQPVCPARQPNNVRFVDPESLKWNCENTHWNWAPRTHKFLTWTGLCYTLAYDFVSRPLNEWVLFLPNSFLYICELQGAIFWAVRPICFCFRSSAKRLHLLSTLTDLYLSKIFYVQLEWR